MPNVCGAPGDISLLFFVSAKTDDGERGDGRS